MSAFGKRRRLLCRHASTLRSPNRWRTFVTMPSVLVARCWLFLAVLLHVIAHQWMCLVTSIGGSLPARGYRARDSIGSRLSRTVHYVR